MTITGNNEWIDCEKELPLMDGIYEVCCSQKDVGLAEYDGYGFKLYGIYRNPKYWRKNEELIKKYGKQI